MNENVSFVVAAILNSVMKESCINLQLLLSRQINQHLPQALLFLLFVVSERLFGGCERCQIEKDTEKEICSLFTDDSLALQLLQESHYLWASCKVTCRSLAVLFNQF